ncbi:DsbA family oxidoreductase [Cohnella nanjingensis]|uniref:DsbA family oxidoreductase n=1 Tax=Cohnella nanjingensis TaxID=1387779 RepID=A0A7X0VDF6_9BACL|nr:DsbA family oxidoreductase [Cohnella nanjingensis]MBB6669910.1 DsbA family oxidoreductase [Cohnella nanjingensis]
MQIDIYSDMVCPWCRIGKKNVLDAVSEWTAKTGEEVDVRYHAFLLDPTLPEEGLPFESSMSRKMGGADRIPEMLQRVTDAGAAVGVTFRFDRVTRMPNTVLAHRLAYLAPESQREQWIDAVMTAYFEYGRDIAKPEVLLEIASDLGLPSFELEAGLTEGRGAEEVQQDLDHASAMGISGVPFFVLNNKYGLSGAYPASEFLKAFEKIVQQPQS